MGRTERVFWLAVSSVLMAGCGGAGTKTKPPPRVTVAHPEVRDLQDEEDYNGWLVASKSVEVKARVRGHIKEVLFKDGDIVEQGQPLFELDSAPYKAELAQAEAQVKALKAQRVFAEKDVERNQILAKSSAVSKQDLEKSEAHVESVIAEIAAKEAEMERRRLDVDYTKIKAEWAGKVSKAELVVGALVNAGGTDPLLTTLVAMDPIYVDFSVDERAIQHYRKSHTGEEPPKPLRDRKVSFTFGLDTESGFPNTAHLVFADNKFSESTGTVLLRGESPNADGRLVPGSRVRVRIPVSDKYEAVVVPDTAVLSDQDRKYLLVLGEDNTVLRRDVTLGRLLDDGMRVVRPALGEKSESGPDWNGSWASTWVITVGLQRARVNEPVEPLDPQGQPIDTTSKGK